MAGRMIPDNAESRALETTETYTIGKTTVFVDRIFRRENAETLSDIILKLMKKEAEKP